MYIHSLHHAIIHFSISDLLEVNKGCISMYVVLSGIPAKARLAGNLPIGLGENTRLLFSTVH